MSCVHARPDTDRHHGKVKNRSAVPTIASGVQIAFPSAILGAILGEFAGGEDGLGVFMMNSLAQSIRSERGAPVSSPRFSEPWDLLCSVSFSAA